ncbi:MAG: redoxin domain-containing protein [Planctomycetes bacterium]|nr:redoxin domain-containing protein [Planctomycetota bacterium]
MRTLFLIAPLALFAGQSGAQQKAAAPQETVSPEQKKLDELLERFNQKRADVLEAYKKATTDDEREKIYAGMPGEDFIPAFKALAVEVKGTDAAAHAWMWVLQLDQDRSEGMTEIVELLLSEHMESEVLADLAGFMLFGSQTLGQGPTLESLDAMIDGSSKKKVQASALFTKGSILLNAKLESSRAEGRKCMERVVANYPGIDSGRGTYADRAAGSLFELDHLQIGKAAPDFEATDENGVKWKLSDYRGKVVVVDFWGYW